MEDIIVQISNYIKDYLFENDKLSIKGLGTFSVKTIEANIDELSKNVTPKQRLVSFTTDDKATSKGFFDFVAQKSGKLSAAIEVYVDRFVTDLTRKIDNKESISIDGFGTFGTNSDNIRIFTPDANLNLSKSTAALNPVDLPKYNDKSSIVPGITNVEEEEKVTLAEVLFDDLASVKDLHKKTFTDETAIENQPIAEQAAEAPKKTMKEVLEENAKDIEAKEIKPTRRKMDWETEETAPTEAKKEGGTNWFWVLPLVLLFFICLMLYQIATSDKPLNELAPFSWFMQPNETSTDNQLADNTSNSSVNSNNTITNENPDNNSSETDNGSNDEIAYNEGDTNEGDANSSNDENTTGDDGNEANNSSNSDDASAKATNESPDNTNANNSASNQSTTTQSTPTNNSNAVANLGIPKSINALMNENVPKGYHMVIGAFGEANNALKTVNKLRKKGYEAYAIKNKNNLYQCMVYAGNSQNDAEAKIGDIRANIEKGAWVFKQN